jgi:transforming growth factor-beta-induced protein
MLISRRIKFVYAFLVLALAFGALGVPSARAAQTSGTIVDVALAANAQTGEFSILVAALQAANPDVIRRLSNPEREFTVFAPTDAAFTALLAELGVTADQLLSDKPTLSRVLRYHIARGELEAAEVLASDRIRTIQGGRLWQSGGVLTDANGRTSNIIQTDIQASNGVIHVIDTVLLPRPKPTRVEGSIVDTALAVNAETGEFSILIAALQAANPSIMRRLSMAGEYTVFAPTDAAFLDLLDELGLTAEELLSNRPLVSRVLRYHILREELDSTEVLASERIRTWQGGWLFQSGGILTDANGRTSNIIDVDIQTSNGIIHIIDTVVLPKMNN